MIKKLIILTIVVTFILPLIAAITIYQYNKPVTNKQIEMVIIESDGISNDKNNPKYMTTFEDPTGNQYDVYSNQIEPINNKVLATINNKNEVTNYKVIE